MAKCLTLKTISKGLNFLVTGMKWMPVLLLLQGFRLAAQQPAVKTISLFNEQTLKGWKFVTAEDKKLWSVVNGIIVCNNAGEYLNSNSFLHTENEFQDFEFRCLFRLSGDSGFINSGIQYRSKLIKGNVTGYQADIGKGYWGDLYDEHRRGTLLKGDTTILHHLLFEDNWNSYIIRVKGRHHELYINGIKTADYFEKDPSIPSKGFIALQIHSGGIAKVEFKKIEITVY